MHCHPPQQTRCLRCPSTVALAGAPAGSRLPAPAQPPSLHSNASCANKQTKLVGWKGGKAEENQNKMSPSFLTAFLQLFFFFFCSSVLEVVCCRSCCSSCSSCSSSSLFFIILVSLFVFLLLQYPCLLLRLPSSSFFLSTTIFPPASPLSSIICCIVESREDIDWAVLSVKQNRKKQTKKETSRRIEAK